MILLPLRDKSSKSWLRNQWKKFGPLILFSERSRVLRDEARPHLGESNWRSLLERLRDLRLKHVERKERSEKDEESVFSDRSSVVRVEVHLVWERGMGGEDVMFVDLRVRIWR